MVCKLLFKANINKNKSREESRLLFFDDNDYLSFQSFVDYG